MVTGNWHLPNCSFFASIRIHICSNSCSWNKCWYSAEQCWPIAVLWLPVLSSVAPPSLHRKVATDTMLQIIEAHPSWPVYADVFEHPPPWLASWRQIWSNNICQHSYAVKSGLVVDFCGQPHYCYRPYYLTARFRSPSSYMVSDEPFPVRSRPMSC